MKGKKYGGRVAGTPNKVTLVNRELITKLAEGMVDQVIKDIAELNPEERVKVFIKLCEFNIPKPQTISLGLDAEVKKTIEDKLMQLSSTNEK